MKTLHRDRSEAPKFTIGTLLNAIYIFPKVFLDIESESNDSGISTRVKQKKKRKYTCINKNPNESF